MTKTILRRCVLLVGALIWMLCMPLTVEAEGAVNDNPDDWILSNVYYDGSEGGFVLTNEAKYVSGTMWYNYPCGGNFEIELDYYTGRNNAELKGADGIAVVFYATCAYVGSSGQHLCFAGSEGYGIELDTYYNSNWGDIKDNHIALIKDSSSNHLITALLPESEDKNWHHLKVVVEDGICYAYVDNVLKFSHAVEKTGNDWIGITATTGAGFNRHAVKNIRITREEDSQVEETHLDIELTYEKTEDFYSEEENNGKYTYELTAQIINAADVTAPEVIATLELDEELVLQGENVSYALGNLEPGASRAVTWTVSAEWPVSNVYTTYGVRLQVNNQFELKKEEGIYLLTKNKNSNEFELGKDQWSFSNDDEYFDPDKNEDYFMNELDMDSLIAGLSRIDAETVKSLKKRKWGGSCYGMTATAILTKMGVIEPDKIQDGKKQLFDVTKINNDSIESFVNFYHVQQVLNAPASDMAYFARLSTKEQLESIETMASEVLLGGSPILLAFGGKDWGHAVVAYGVEHHGGKGYPVGGGIFNIGATYYDSRIILYDCNSPNEKRYLYYNKGTDEWTIPYELYLESGLNKLIMSCNDLSIIDTINHETTTDNYVARINYLSSVNEYNLHYNGETFLINGKTDEREKGIVAYFLCDLPTDGAYGPETLITTLPDKKGEYSIEPMGDESGEMALYYENCLLTMEYEGVDNITFAEGGSLNADGVSGAYEMTLVANDGYYTLPWYKLSIEGQDAGNISMEQNDAGMVISGTNLQDVKVKVTDGEEEKQLDFSTEKESVLLTSEVTDDGEVPIVLIDTDNDGTYEEKLWTGECSGGVGCPSLEFSDVDQNQWYHQSVDYAIYNKLMTGKGQDENGNIIFDPNKAIPREEFVQVLYNASGKPTVSIENKFPDVKNAWYKNAVLWANANDIANGKGNGDFGVTEFISRQDLALMLYKYALMNGYDLTANFGEIDKYADGAKVNDYAKTAMDWAITKGVMSGKGTKGEDISTFRLDPAGTATRAECAAMLKNFMEAYGE